MSWLIDTNIISFAMKKRHGLEERFLSIPTHRLFLSVIVLAEGRTGAYRTVVPERWLALWTAMTGGWKVLPFDADCADIYARLRSDLEGRGCMIGVHDAQIAATAIRYDLILVTDNSDEFGRVPGLKIENWLSGHDGSIG